MGTIVTTTAVIWIEKVVTELTAEEAAALKLSFGMEVKLMISIIR
jgi:hypothetical protein